MSFEWVPFTELLSAIVDNRGKTCPVGDSGLPLIATNCISNGSLYPSYDTTRFVNEETYNSWFRGHPKPGDILFVCKGSPGRTNWVPDPVDFCIAQDMVAVRADRRNIYPKYLFAVLRSSVVQSQIDNMHVGTMIPHFKKGDFGKLKIPVPSEAAQTFIGDYYFAMSERVNLLRETNATLEAIAQALFKSWFVDFDPVRAKTEGREPEGLAPETAALFPDGLEESELGQIPKGWTRSSLGEVSSYLNRGISPKYVDEGGVCVINQKCIRDGILDLSKARRHDSAQRKIGGRELEIGDVLVNSTGVGTLGRVAPVLSLEEPAIVDSHVTVVRAGGQITQTFLGLCMLRRQPEIERLGEGSTGQTELSRSKLAELNIILPPRGILEAFDSIVQPVFKRFAGNLSQAQTLSSLRDTLLPRLISGQLRLSDAEELLKNAA